MSDAELIRARLRCPDCKAELIIYASAIGCPNCPSRLLSRELLQLHHFTWRQILRAAPQQVSRSRLDRELLKSR